MINAAAPDFHNTPTSSLRPNYSYRPDSPEALPFVTIITPFYNVSAPIFRETAQTILGQSFQQWEWLIINDGSTDAAALTHLTTYRTLEPRIRVIDLESNRGPCIARNIGFRAAQTEFVVTLDADDLLEPTAIEKWFWFLVTHPEYSFTKGYSIGFGSQEYLWPHGFELAEHFLTENPIDQTAMIRRTVWQQVGGFDESNREGLEDWEFWIRCANAGYWGATIPEYHDWYRRRDNHGERWLNWSSQTKVARFQQELQKKYPQLYEGHFPKIERSQAAPYTSIPLQQPCRNLIAKPTQRQRILMLLPWLVTGGADKFNLDLVEGLSAKNYEISICTTLPSDNNWLVYFAKFTPDIFNLSNFLELIDFPRFLLYLINSRQIEIVFISNSYLSYQLLPFLRAHCPQTTFVDYTHIEEPHWKSGGYPRASVGYQELLDLRIVTSHYLKQWQIKQGSNPERIEVCYINVDPNVWHLAHFNRDNLRQELAVSAEMPLILYAGRMTAQKRPHLFAEIIRQLVCEENLPFICLVAGDGPDLPALQEFINSHKLQQQIYFLGEVPPSRMQELQAAADIFLLPSEYEGISLAIYEAMAMQTVPVSAAVGGQMELVTPECGYLIPHGPQEIKEYVIALKRLIQFPQQRQCMAIAGRQRIINHFSLDKMVNRMIELFNQAEELAQKSPCPPVGRGLGIECATLVIEYTRLEQSWKSAELTQDMLNRLSGEEISQRIPIKKMMKALGFKIAAQPGLQWLYQFRNLGKKILGS